MAYNDVGKYESRCSSSYYSKSQETGWHVFWSSVLEESGEYKGFYIAQGGKYDGKIVEKNANGEEVRPLDISITKIVFALLLNCLILVGIILGVAHWYKKRTRNLIRREGLSVSWKCLL